MKVSKILSAALLLQTSLALADGIEFQPLPIDINQKCSVTILQGTRRFEGVGFVMPRVLLSVSKHRDPMFEIISLENEKYLLRMGIFIPTDMKAAGEFRQSDTASIIQDCNYDDIRHALSKYTKKNRSSGAPTIYRLAPLPITKIDVSIDGVEDVYTIGGKTKSDLLDYTGVDQVAEFTLNSKKQLNELLARLNGDIGLSAQVSMTFRARSVENYDSLSIDTKQLATRLEAAFKGQIKIVHTDLATAVANSMKAMKIKIYSEGESSQAFKDLAQSLIQKVVDQNPTAFDEHLPTMTPAEKSKHQYEVKAFLQHLKATASLSLEVLKMGEEEDRIYSTPIIVKPSVVDIMSKAHRIASDTGRISLPAFVHKGDAVELIISGYTTEKLKENLPNVDRYLSITDMDREFANRSNFTLLFPDGQPEGLEETETPKGPKAVITKIPFSSYLSYAFGPVIGSATMNIKTTSWGIREYLPYYQLSTSEGIFNMTRQPLDRIPIKVNFSKVGSKWFTLRDLVIKNDYFDGSYDAYAGKIILRAKQNLGNVAAINEEKAPMVRKVMRQYFEEKASTHNGNKRRYVDGAPKSVASQRSFYNLKINWSVGTAKTFEVE